MTDRSKIIRHPDVVAAEFERIKNDLHVIAKKLQTLGQELDQVSDIAHEIHEMMQPKDDQWRDPFTYDNERRPR
jgi:DNA anti-recombination protein RmuC